MKNPLNTDKQYRQIMALDWQTKEASILQLMPGLNHWQRYYLRFFNQLAYQLMIILNYPNNQTEINLNAWQFFDILKDFPGSINVPNIDEEGSIQSYKYWVAKDLEKGRAPLDITNADLVEIANQFIWEYAIIRKQTIEIPEMKEEWKPYFMTALAINAFLNEAPEVKTIRFQITSPY